MTQDSHPPRKTKSTIDRASERSDAEDDLEGNDSCVSGFGVLGDTESEDRVSRVLVIRERRHKMTWNSPIRELGDKILYMPAETSERRKFGSRGSTQRWHAWLIIRGSGRHRAGTGDQDKVGRTSGECPSRRLGALTAYSKCGPLLGPQMAVTMRSTSRLEWRDPLRWCAETQEKCLWKTR